MLLVEGINYIIRPAQSADVGIIEHLLTSGNLSSVGVQEYISGFMVAEQGDRVVCVIGSELAEKTALLRSFAADPAVQGRRIASRLLVALLERLREQGIVSVYLLTNTAMDYFARRGFEVIDRQDIPNDLVSASVLA